MNENEAAWSPPGDPEVQAMAEDRLHDADQHVRTFLQAMASLEAFGQAYWSLDRLLSWITYRNSFHLNTSYLRGILYPTILGIPPVVELQASSKLLQALRRANSPIVCFKNGRELHGSEWEPVNFPSDPKRWPQGSFAREAVTREWPATHVSGVDDGQVGCKQAISAPSLNREPIETEIYGPRCLSDLTSDERIEQLKFLAETITSRKSSRWDATPTNKKPGVPKTYPFKVELERLFGGRISRDREARPVWDGLPKKPKAGRPSDRRE